VRGLSSARFAEYNQRGGPAERKLVKNVAVISCLAVAALAALPLAHAAGGAGSSPASGPTAARFADPPARARILKIVHGLPDAPEAQDRLLRTLAAQGFGGIVCNVSFTDYLESEAKWKAFLRGVEEAKKAGMVMWLYDERGYPSGTAGGLTLRGHPEWEARGLLIADAKTGGGAVSLDVPPGRLFRAAAFPVAGGAIDLDKPVDLAGSIRDGKLRWDAPAGEWHVMAITEDRLYEGTHAALSLADKRPYVNLLQPEPTARFLELTHEAYAARLGRDLGKWFVGTFTDEPSLMSMFLRAMPYRALPWSPDLPGQFQARRGYGLGPVVPALVADAGPRGRRARYDFWLTVAELVSENYFRQIRDWCRRHNVPSGGHLLLEEPLVAHVPLYGDLFRCERFLDAPSLDCLTSLPPEVHWHSARLVASAAELEGRPDTMCETSDHAQHWRPQGDTRPRRQVTEEEIRGTCNRLILSGITTVTSYYSFSGLNDAQINRLNQWVGRCCTMLYGGRQAADVAVVYPIESVWPRFAPARDWTKDAPASAHAVERTYRDAAEELFANRRDFTFIDSRTLVEGDSADGTLKYAGLGWRVVVLPCVDTLPLKAWQNLARFWRTGGVVVAVGALPANSETEFPAAAVQKLSREVFGEVSGPSVTANAAGGAGIYLPPGCEALLPAALDRVLGRDVEVTPQRAPLRVTHRRIDGHEVFFVINDSANPWEGEVRLAAGGPVQRWDPASGAVTRLPADAGIPVKLEPYGGVFFTATEARLPQRLKVRSGALPLPVLEPLPPVQPVMGKGEFVKAELGRDPARDRPGSPVWRAAATLTKGKVDTHLFTSFQYPAGIDLSAASFLSAETWVPDEQRTPSELLVIVRDADGREYFAPTGRLLGSPGQARFFVPLSRFQHAGWSKDAGGPFDWARVKGVSIGWGGYFGAEGEKIEFSLAPPQTGKVSAAARDRTGS
jgi:hypothetical protein